MSLICASSCTALYRPVPPAARNAEQFLRLWRNEALRVFHDRLINQEDKQLVLNRMSELVEQKFPTCSSHTLKNPILFGDFRCVAGPYTGSFFRTAFAPLASAPSTICSTQLPCSTQQNLLCRHWLYPRASCVAS